MNTFLQKRIDFENNFKKHYFCYYKLIAALKEIKTVEHYCSDFQSEGAPLKNIKNKDLHKFTANSDFAYFLEKFKVSIYWKYRFTDNLIISEMCRIFGCKEDGLWFRIYSPCLVKHDKKQIKQKKSISKIFDSKDSCENLEFDTESINFLFEQRLEIYKKINHPALIKHYKEKKLWILITDNEMNLTDKICCK